MFKKRFALVVIVLLLVFAISAATIMPKSHQAQSPLQKTPVGPVTQEQAIDVAIHAAQSWHEPNPQIVTVRKQLRSDFINQLKAQGDDGLIAGTGDVWIVDLSGKFTPNRVRPGTILQCDAIFVVVDIESGEMIGAGCR